MGLWNTSPRWFFMARSFLVAHLSQDRAGVSIECLHLENVVVVIEAGVAQHPVRFPVSETRPAQYISPEQLKGTCCTPWDCSSRGRSETCWRTASCYFRWYSSQWCSSGVSCPWRLRTVCPWDVLLSWSLASSSVCSEGCGRISSLYNCLQISFPPASSVCDSGLNSVNYRKLFNQTF